LFLRNHISSNECPESWTKATCSLVHFDLLPRKKHFSNIQLKSLLLLKCPCTNCGWLWLSVRVQFMMGKTEDWLDKVEFDVSSDEVIEKRGQIFYTY
jgi:hypothetical protein